MGFRVWGLGFRVWGLGFRVMIYGLVVQGFECKLVESCAILGFTIFLFLRILWVEDTVLGFRGLYSNIIATP